MKADPIPDTLAVQIPGIKMVMRWCVLAATHCSLLAYNTFSVANYYHKGL